MQDENGSSISFGSKVTFNLAIDELTIFINDLD